MAGLIVYDMGRYPAKEITGRNIYPGYVVMRPSESIKHHKAKGIVHGNLSVDFFKKTKDQMANDYGAVIGGFGIEDGVLKFNSGCFNAQAVH